MAHGGEEVGMFPPRGYKTLKPTDGIDGIPWGWLRNHGLPSVGLGSLIKKPCSSNPGSEFRDRESLRLQGLFDVVRIKRDFIPEVETHLAPVHVGLDACLLYPRQSSECAAHSVGSAARSVHRRDVER